MSTDPTEFNPMVITDEHNVQVRLPDDERQQLRDRLLGILKEIWDAVAAVRREENLHEIAWQVPAIPQGLDASQEAVWYQGVRATILGQLEGLGLNHAEGFIFRMIGGRIADGAYPDIKAELDRELGKA